MHEICSAGLSNAIKVLYQRRGVPDSVIEAIIRDGKVSLDLRFKPSQILNALDRPKAVYRAGFLNDRLMLDTARLTI